MRLLDARALVPVFGGLMAVVLLVGLVLPGSVFEHREAIGLATPLRALYDRTWVTATFALLVGLYVASLVFASRVEAAGAWRQALAVAALLGVLCVFAYPSGSRDIFKNISDSRTLWLYGQDPKAMGPARANPDDPMLDSLTLATWRREPGFYGHLTYVAYGPPALLGGDTALGNMIAFKAYHALILVAMAVAAAAAVPAKSRAWSVVFIGWNPLLLFEGVVSAHNDLIMAALFLGGLVLIARWRLVAGGALFAASVGVKLATGFAAPVVYVWLLRSSAGRLRLALLAAGAIAAVGGAAYLYLEGMPAMGLFIRTRPFFTLYSLIFNELRPDYGADTARAVARAVCLAGLALVYAGVLLRTRAGATSLYSGTFWVLVATSALAVVYAWPWYFIWFIPIAALLPRSLAAETSVVFTACGLGSYFLSGWPEGVQNANLVITVILFGLPALYAGVSLVGRRRLTA